MYFNFSLRSASCEDPDGLYEERVRCAAMEVVERIVIDQLVIL